MQGRTKQDFLDFLDWVAAKGLLPLNTAHARKAVANKVLAVLEAEELEDVTALDMENVMLRFTNKFGKRYTPESLRTYRSRFESSVSDFKAYCSDPVGFRPAWRPSVRQKSPENGNLQSVVSPTVKRKRFDHPSAATSSQPHQLVEHPAVSPANVIPIQIRPDLTIRVGPVPYDLTAAEAKRVANVIMALASADIE